MISPASRPRLAPKTRLRFDRKTDRTLLLFPEKGLELSPTASAILQLCNGERTVAEIVDALAERYQPPERARVEREVTEFLTEMTERCLVQEAP